jgi:hypothetical protein
MKRQLIFGTMLSATLAVGVAAQQPPATGSTTPAGQPPSDRPSASQSMTLTGCLKEAPGGGAATAPGGATAGASQARGGFILADAKPAGSMAGGATAPGAATGTSGAGATGTAGSASAQSTYRLTGGDNLQQYVGQKVEITGTAASGASSGSPSSPGAPASPGAEKPASGSGQGPALRVTTVRPTGDKCN